MPAISDLSLRQLEYVVAVAETAGFHRAAERCNVSQPTLSAQIAQVESVLGVRLFERARTGVLVTPQGQAIVDRARRVLREMGDLLAAAARGNDPFAGTFRLGVIPTVAPYLLPEVMPALGRRYPNLQIVLREERTDEVTRDLRQATLDLGLLALEADLGEHEAHEVLKDPFVVAMPLGHPLAKKKRIAIADLEKEPVLLLDDGHCFRTQALALCSKAGVRETGFRATSLATLVQMVSAGRGITLLPKLAVEVENRRGQIEIRPFVPPAPSRTIALVWRPSSPFGAAFHELGDTLKQRG
ncbi:MAG TPA: LysR substrate-binding domain-containing protein [Polyangiaceae bacterium]|jgi:LysR family hydrogen peroxide-inducible transcriptional activator|nr:LysR substrate-binding domain-containing protein [Polyangiaceae bacterium]